MAALVITRTYGLTSRVEDGGARGLQAIHPSPDLREAPSRRIRGDAKGRREGAGRDHSVNGAFAQCDHGDNLTKPKKAVICEVFDHSLRSRAEQ